MSKKDIRDFDKHNLFDLRLGLFFATTPASSKLVGSKADVIRSLKHSE